MEGPAFLDVYADTLSGEVVKAAVAALAAIGIVDKILDVNAGVAAGLGDPQLFADQVPIAGEKLLMGFHVAHVALALRIDVERGEGRRVDRQVDGVRRHAGGEFDRIGVVECPAVAIRLIEDVRRHCISHAGSRAS